MAKALQRFAGEKAAEKPQSARSWACIAYGCPAAAGIDAGGGNVICRFHHGTSPSEWPEITRRLNLRDWLVRIADYCASGDVSPGWADRAIAATEANGWPDLAPSVRAALGGVIRDEREYPLLYAQRLNAVLALECEPRRRAHVEPLPGRADRGAVKVGEALPAFARTERAS